MMSMNDAFVDDLYFDYLRDPSSVSAAWQEFFKTYTPEGGITASAALAAHVAPSAAPAPTNGTAATAVAAAGHVPARMPALMEGDNIVQLSSIGGKIAENMVASLNVPTATSVRSIPVKALEENRRILNQVLARRRMPKLSFTHILAYAIVKAVERTPNMKNSYGFHDGAHVRIERGGVNLGLAVDTTRKDGTRILLVPSIKHAERLTFAEFAAAYDGLIAKARTNKLSPEDLTGANVTLTNPGMIGTVMSVPRLMEGQGTIVAAGSIEYPAEFQAMMPDVLSSLAISKTVTITSTYDHRVIQGAESGEFLQYMHQLLVGEHRFYDQIFASFQLPFEPIRWSIEHGHNPFYVGDQPDIVEKEARVLQMINAYRVRGHVLADVNPLGLEAHHYPELDPSYYGLTIWDLDRQFDTGGLGGVNRATLRDVIDMLRDIYCDQIGIEYMHIQDSDKKSWIRTNAEQSRLKIPLSADQRLDTFRKLAKAELLENFLHTKFLGAKRFSLEGGEATLTILDQILDRAANHEAAAAVIGMAHRGRLNVLVNMMGKPLTKLFNEFEGIKDQDSWQGSGDVKYHLGAKGTYVASSNKSLPIVLAPNPSHLEAVNPVVEGIARALDDSINDSTYSKAIPVLIHGDAAFAGQGVVAETLNLARLRGYSTGGTLHIVINNQIGFTTSPEDSRSTHYATGIAKMLQVPILHVNGDDPEACRAAANFAFDYRARFGEDVVIDMYCYRKYGHNEQDDPTATQPLLYKKIKTQMPVRKLYAQRLIGTKVASSEQLDVIVAEEQAILNTAFDSRAAQGAKTPVEFESHPDTFVPVATAVDEASLAPIVDAICSYPETFNIHPKVKAEVDKRRQQYAEGIVQWGMAEALAYGTLMVEGHGVRITGQDSGRGTFNHRQAVQSDIVNEYRRIPLNTLPAPAARLRIYDSPLSEYAVMGFEYGYSTVAKNGLTIWEAQFGDFANGAQIMIDQFIASAETKWGQRSNITLLLPHGYDGQGPEHSSARLERFLQLCAEDNMIVANYTSPANFFHALRRQVKAGWRKPMVVMTPKGYLRTFQSPLTEITHGSYQEILDDATIADRTSVRRVVICSGKVSSELAKRRSEAGRSDVAIVRLEQIYPFHAERMREVLASYANAAEVIWCQEEPRNAGAWFFVREHIEAAMQASQHLRYVGRAAAAAPATGSAATHDKEQAALLAEAIG
ncbi:MAG: multifunctional oxoglutarate decarboxylase/oxoglutarate dehydrogenase thiamine pyrophosphate-binding subunit/dihydrolipoyllysine-residue succinyltransferase subunit [Candidatus Kapabacteria bacterium]|nr:multifunctional oxoglutarate decarboxylase/oxoglutarate dehydrogenase thiamine pyrophosphate-binding subunit/dihydrolipoyllysine-residue succinyltransferase subunit [Candidatus Kapabacteria bacterium]